WTLCPMRPFADVADDDPQGGVEAAPLADRGGWQWWIALVLMEDFDPLRFGQGVLSGLPVQRQPTHPTATGSP
ncbi:MAG: hypothetical protein OER86_06620, partial [Phycisphaerae bacterium]|nr:hypothetical protein [Phycisphaerae bacterium]